MLSSGSYFYLGVLVEQINKFFSYGVSLQYPFLTVS